MEETAAILPRTCTRRFVDLRRLARRRPVVALDFLLDLIREHPPVPAGEAAAWRPDFRALVVGVEDGRLRTLRAFATLEEELAAIRAAMSIPVWAGAAAEFRGELVSDGGLIESIPVHTPLAEGATHVVVLRSRDAAYRKGARGRLQGAAEDVVLNRLPGRLPDLVRSRPARYDAQADELVAAAAGEGPLAGRAVQIAPDPGTPLVARLDVDRARVLAALEAGRAAAERALSPR
jgi:predicted patatin/cPLA2 family phospholipase